MEVKYNYQNTTLYQFCKINGFIYKNIIASILYYTKRYQKYSQNKNEAIDMVIGRQTILAERRIKKNAFLAILNDRFNITKIAKVLHINIQAIYKLKKYGFSLRQSMIILYFLADYDIEDRRISIKRIRHILEELKIQNYTKEYAYLFCYYYLGYDTQTHIVTLSSPMCIHNIYNIANYYCLKLEKEDLEDVIQNVNIKIMELIRNKKILLNESSQIRSYIYKSVKNQIYNDIKEIKKHADHAHLEDKIGENRTLMDVIPCGYSGWK